MMRQYHADIEKRNVFNNARRRVIRLEKQLCNNMGVVIVAVLCQYSHCSKIFHNVLHLFIKKQCHLMQF